MSAEILFDRGARVVFGKILTENGREVRDLRVKFKVEKTSESTPNKATIAVYNLNQQSRAIAEAEGNLITFDAGYQGRLENIFIGDVARAISTVSGTDIITEFECGDGERAYQDSTLDKSFSPGTGISQVFSAAAESLGLTQGEQADVGDKSYLNGLSVSGPVRNILDSLTATQDLEWSIQDGALQITKVKGKTQAEAVELTSNSGLLDSPKKKDKGLEVKALLNPKFKPGRGVFITSIAVKRGLYVIRRVVHEGDTHGNEWFSTLEVEPVG